MAKKQVAWNVKTKEVIVANDGTALKPDFVKAGTFDHGAAGDPVGDGIRATSFTITYRKSCITRVITICRLCPSHLSNLNQQ